MNVPILTPDQRVRVFDSSTRVNWHRGGRRSAGRSSGRQLLPVMFELGAAPADLAARSRATAALLLGERAEAAVVEKVAQEALTNAQDGGGEPVALARLVGQIGTAIFRTGRGDRWTDGLRYPHAGRTAGPHMACGP